MPTEASRIEVLVSTQSVRWGDMDGLGHVNNTCYFRYMEQARIEWLHAVARARGRPDEAMGSVIVNASCTFVVPIVYPARIDVHMYLATPGRTSVTSYYDIRQEGRSMAEGSAKIVWMDNATGRPTPLPDVVRALFDVREAGWA